MRSCVLGFVGAMVGVGQGWVVFNMGTSLDLVPASCADPQEQRGVLHGVSKQTIV